MDKRELLKNMLNNWIHDKREEAELDLHNYLTAKMKTVSGIAVSDGDDSVSHGDEDLSDNDSTTPDETSDSMSDKT